MLLDRQDLIWIDIQVERRVATLRVNIFVGENAGNRLFKVGVLCLIGIAHLHETTRDLKYSKRFELRPFRQLDLGPSVSEEIGPLSASLDKILMNLFHAVKLVCAKTLVHCPISGNIILAHNGMIMNDQTPGYENLTASQFAYHVEEKATTTTTAACQTTVRATEVVLGGRRGDGEESKERQLQKSAGPLTMSELGVGH